MQSYRYLLIVDEPDGRLATLGQELRERGYRAVCVPSARDALDFAKAFPKLFLCFVNEAQLGKSSEHFLEDVDTMREGLPIAWVHDGKPPVFLERRPELMFGPDVSADEFVKNVTRTLGGERYPRELLEEFAVCATVALSSLAAHTVSGDAFVRESWTPLSELNALIPFSGPAAHGQMIVGCTETCGAGIYRREFGDQEPIGTEHVGDLLAEVCNRALGKLLQYFESRGSVVTMGLPMVIRQGGSITSPRIRSRGRQHSVGLEFEGLDGRLCFELCCEYFDQQSLRPPRPVTGLKRGEIMFL